MEEIDEGVIRGPYLRSM